MTDKPTTAAGYRREQVELVRATCLYVATKLGDLMDDQVVVGGLVPSLLIPPDELPEGTEPHVGTMDLDVGLTLTLLDEGRYKTLTERLRHAGFEQDVNDKGKLLGPQQEQLTATRPSELAPSVGAYDEHTPPHRSMSTGQNRRGCSTRPSG